MEYVSISNCSIIAEREFDFRKLPLQNTCSQLYRCHKHKPFDRYKYEMFKNTYLLIGENQICQPLPFNLLGTTHLFNEKAPRAMNLNDFQQKC